MDYDLRITLASVRDAVKALIREMQRANDLKEAELKRNTADSVNKQ